MKVDLSGLSHDQPPPFQIGPVERILIAASGHSPGTVVETCSAEERNTLKWLGGVLLGSAGLSALTTTGILHMGFGDGGFHPTYVLVGLAVGALQGAIDVVAQYKGTVNERGLTQLRLTGLKLAGSPKTGWLTHLVRPVRFLQAGALGALGGLFLTLGILGQDIRARIDNDFRASNRAAAEETTKLVDANTARTAEELKSETTHVDQLNRILLSLRQENVRRFVRAGSRKGTPSTMASDTQVTSLDRSLAEAAAKRDALRDTLNRQSRDRNLDIEQGILSSPQHVEKQAGVLGELNVFSDMSRENPKLLLLALAFEIISLALELGPIWCAASYIPSAFAARLALSHYVEVSRLAKEGAMQLGLQEPTSETPDEGAENTDEVNRSTDRDIASPGANDNEAIASGLNGATPPRRGRGRPRTKGLHQDGKEQGNA